MQPQLHFNIRRVTWQPRVELKCALLSHLIEKEGDEILLSIHAELFIREISLVAMYVREGVYRARMHCTLTLTIIRERSFEILCYVVEKRRANRRARVHIRSQSGG